MRNALSIYVRVVVLAGVMVVGHSLAILPATPHPLEWLLFASLAVATGSFTINVASVEASISVADTFFITSSLLFGPAPVTVAMAFDSFLLSARRRHHWRRLAFNTAAPALSIWVATTAFFHLARVAPLAESPAPIGRLLLPLFCLAAIYFGLNSWLTAIAVGLEAQQSPLKIWREHFAWLAVGYLAAASLAMCLVVIVQQSSLVAAAVILPVLAVIHATLRSSFGRLEDARQHVAKVDRLYKSTIETLAMAIDAKDDVTHNHVRRVQSMATALAARLGVADEPTVKAIEAAALLHDTGKLAVPEHILNKPGKLTASEFDEMKKHVDVGADILALVDFPFPVVPIVRCHHENWDGTGYPRGVSGEEIPIGARILSVVDCYDALTSDRPYRRALTQEAAFEILSERRGTMYDPAVVDAFIAMRAAESGPPVDERPSVPPAFQAITTRLQQSGRHAVVSPARPSIASSDVMAFMSLARLTAGNGSRQDVFALIASLLGSIVPGASIAFYLGVPAGNVLTAAEAIGPASDRVRGLRIREGDRLTGWVAANRRAIVNSDAALDLGERASADGDTLRSCLSVPLEVGATLEGVLTLYTSAERFTDEQASLVQVLAPHIAQALHAAGAAADAPRVQTARDLKLVSAR